jgi:hypothetical protein
MINCDHCGKIFKYNCHLLRHLSGKFPCYTKPPPGYVDIMFRKNQHNVEENQHNVEENQHNVDETQHNVEAIDHIDEQNNEFKCHKCEKNFFNKCSLKRHLKICNGCHVLQCPICLKMFSSTSSKSHHIKKVKCKPSENICQPVNSGTVNINSNSHNNITNNVTNNIDNSTLNNNVYLVNFSDTDYSHISVDQIVRMVAKCHASPSRFFNMMITEAHKNEYANVGLSNIKGNYATIYDEQQFLKVSAEEIAEEIGIKIAHRMDDCVTDSENKEILKHGNIYKRVKSYSWIEDVVRGISSSEYDDETSDALRTLNMNKRDAVDKINQSIRFGLHNVHINMKGMKGKMNT